MGRMLRRNRKRLFNWVVVLCCVIAVFGVIMLIKFSIDTSQTSADNGGNTPEVTIQPTEVPLVLPTMGVDNTDEPIDEPEPTQAPKTTLDPNKPIVALSFDDGPNEHSTPRVLDLLEKYNCKASFFMVGYNVKINKEIVKRMYDMGCDIGNHTEDHTVHFKKASPDEIRGSLKSVDDMFIEITGVRASMVRPPWGEFNDTVLATIDRPVVLWSVDTLDWKTRNPDMIFDQVKHDVFDGAIILMHDIYGTTADACERVIPWLIEQGYQVTSVSELYAARGLDFGPGSIHRMAKPPITASGAD